MEQTSYGATGRRKAAVARVEVTPGKGTFMVNGSEVDSYLKRQTLIAHARQPLILTDMMGQLDVKAQASGGGLSGQAGALRLALSRALCKLNEELHSSLRKAGYLTVDARKVERKKYGQPKARKRFQYSKR